MQAPRVSAFLISVGQMRHHTPSLCNTITRPLLTHEREEGGIKKYGKRSTFLSQSAPFFLPTSPPHFFWPKLTSSSLIFCCPGCPCAYIRQKVCKVSVQPKLRKKRYSLDVLYWWHHHHFNPEARARKNLYLLSTQERVLYGAAQMNPPPRFLEEIPEHLCEEKKEEEKKL